MYDDVEAEGNIEMHEVDVETDFYMHADARDLLQSGYFETEVLDAINAQEVDVEHFTETEEELITETQVEQLGVEKVPETDMEQVPETNAEEVLNEAPTSQRMVRKRKPSQRIVRIKLAKRVGGQGSNKKWSLQDLTGYNTFTCKPPKMNTSTTLQTYHLKQNTLHKHC
ncbi:hypothetical protein LXL04_022959 [Taraxacum kok-saghyz]